MSSASAQHNNFSLNYGIKRFFNYISTTLKYMYSIKSIGAKDVCLLTDTNRESN